MTLSKSLPAQALPAYGVDEDVYIYALGDFAVLAPASQMMAQGTDGAFASGFPWVLTSASVDFQAQGVAPNCIVQLTAPRTQYPGGGQFLAVDSVSGNSITLRRPYKDLNVGQPPAPAAGLTGVGFVINTLGPQLQEAAYDFKQRFAINDTGQDFSRSTAWLYDPEVMKRPTVYWVLHERYTNEQRTDRGDFAIKAKKFEAKLQEVIDRIQLRWGPSGTAAEASTILSCKLSR